ncbi:MAG: AraC family transcriptional regulator [Caulobacteraceae bacterium]|nr:AraC family transcriptional regulator [Caulobacteraceae bacterium]
MNIEAQVQAAQAHSGATFRWGGTDDFADYIGHDPIEIDHDGRPGGARLSRFDLAGHGGSGSIGYFQSDAFRVVMFDCMFDADRAFHIRDDGWVRLNFSLRMEVAMAFGDALQVHEHQPSWRLIHAPPEALVVETIPRAAHLRWVTVCCRPDMISRLSGMALDDLPGRIAGAPDGEGDVVYRPFSLRPNLANATGDALRRPLRSGLRSAFVEAKAQELVILALDEMLTEQAREPQSLRLTPRDERALHEACLILSNRLADPPTLQKLGLMVGVNRNKLHYGFKHLFGMGISDFLRARRLEEARRLLTETDEPLSEVAARTGFRHQCNLSTAFKARYGVTPSAMRSGPGPRPH